MIYHYHDQSTPLFLLNIFVKNEKANLTRAERNEMKKLLPRLIAGYREKDGKMKSSRVSQKGKSAQHKSTAGSRILASLREAVDWAEGKDVPVRVSTVEVPAIDVREVRKQLGLSQAQFAAKFGFQPATLKNWEQGRTRPDGPARVLLAVIARHLDAVEDALQKAS